MNWAILILIVAAVATSALSGTIGMGGGIALIGVMTALLEASVVVPLHGIVQLCSNLTRVALLLKRVRWPIFAVYVGPLAIGVTAARFAYEGVSLPGFRPLIGIFILLFLITRRIKPSMRNLPMWTFAPLGLVVGFLTLFVGATGPLIAPFFLRDDMEPEQVVGTKACVQTFTHLLKIPAFLTLDFNYLEHGVTLGVLIASVVVGTLIGRFALARLPKKVFTWIFEGVLAAVAVYLIVR